MEASSPKALQTVLIFFLQKGENQIDVKLNASFLGFGFDLSEEAPMIELKPAYNDVNDLMGLWISQEHKS